jgi:type IV pilus assembly protein PilO
MKLDSIKSAFEGFDPNDLDFNKAGTWPIGVKFLAYLIPVIAVVAAGYYFLIKDQHAEVVRLQSQEASLKDEYQAKAFQVASLDALRKQMADVEGRFAELLRQLPTQKEVPGLLEDITMIGESAGLKFGLIELQPERREQFYVELPIKVLVQGNYHQMAEFVSGVAAIRRIVTLHDFTLAPTDDAGVLNMEISAKTYRYDDNN